MILDKNQLSSFAISAEYNQRSVISQYRTFYAGKNCSAFLSHKHDDIQQLQHVTTILKSLDAYVYVDWLDKSLPQSPNEVTASKIKEAIKKYDKFILVATDGAIASKWCNWELGYGDAQKYNANKIVLFPIAQTGLKWTGYEYMKLYPTIEYWDGVIYSYIIHGYPSKGFHVVYHYGTEKIIPLGEWLNS